MLKLPEQFKEDLTFEHAVVIIEQYGLGDLLGGMQKMQTAYVECDDSSSFFSNYSWEISAYNVVFENMRKLFY